MTQLIISGTEAVLPLSFACTVKRENSFFTKSGEYTYDCTLHLDNPTNQELYGFLGRTNKSGQIDTGRSAVLIADGHVYCRGTEIVTRWTDETVTIQIVSGESEMNYFAGQDKRLGELNLGNMTTDSWSVMRSHILRHDIDRNSGSKYCLPPIRLANGQMANFWTSGSGNEELILPQPYLIPLMEKVFIALGYTTVDLRRMRTESSGFDYLFLVNTLHSTSYSKIFAGWKVLDLIEAVEQLTGFIFVVGSAGNSITAMKKGDFFADAVKYTLRNVVDQYEAETLEADSQDDADWATSNIKYGMADNDATKLMALPEGVSLLATTKHYNNIDGIINAIKAYGTDYATAKADKVIYVDDSTGRKYITAERNSHDYKIIVAHTEPYYQIQFDGSQHNKPVLLEVDQFAMLQHGEGLPEIEIGITPAPMTFTETVGTEIIDLTAIGDVTGDDGEEEDAETFEDYIGDYQEKDSTAMNLYAAFFNGMYRYVAEAYTDAGHAAALDKLYGYSVTWDGETDDEERSFTGSLRLKDIEDSVYTTDYGIDTAHPTTFETYDPNVIDPRQIYIIRNKAYVVRDIEETITAEGRRKNWKLTCYPLKTEDVSVADRWVLERGGWDDGAAWLDDGRWNDEIL